ncbi:MAG: hypothetical protein A2355_17395 [Spirochaetes bacterium RIFOXYB1_FULL_32_8]|nr:MAG: hypothetical protein A2Y29_15435 [Spirochaetes bacterium GWE2_31_10]OHD74933.1 MAG: hypothetical protein A2355_17395 [Spirochaetes bacterium RIFOXYB1_FULL_32_8]HBD94608.1 hypothetical protein [Spirochaetia bacterium]HBI39276.1 hypothetical protein [Spirochaetia bacterium]
MENKSILTCNNVIIKDPYSYATIKIKDFSIHSGERIFILGTSDHLRTVFMKSILGFICPVSGKILYKDKDLYMRNYKEMLRYRRNVGYSYSQHGLLKHLSIYDNIMLPMQINGELSEYEMGQRVMALFDLLHISLHPFKEAWGLSRVDEKKILLARAVSSKPELLLIDDPTSYVENVDKASIIDCIDTILLELCIERDKTAVIITSEEEGWSAINNDRSLMLEEV